MNPSLNQMTTAHFQILTAPGPGAVAVIELTCDSPDLAQFVLRRVASATPSATPLQMDRICYGRWKEEDLVVVRTSATTWEIQCHGGLVAVRRICSDLLSDGLSERSEIDTTDVPEVCDLPSSGIPTNIDNAIGAALPKATSRKTAGLILAQASNSLRDDLALLQSATTGEPASAETVRNRLAGWRDVACHLTEPWRVVLAGPPNVGKSSLMNAIAGMERSIVCDQPGTTRDVVEMETVIDGWPFRFTDTAGLRESTHDSIEEHGIRRSLLAASACDVLCLVMDPGTDAEDWIQDLIPSALPRHRILVLNKSDLPDCQHGAWENRLPKVLSGIPVISVSAHTHAGLPELLRQIRLAVVPHEPDCTTALPLPTIPFAASLT